MDYRYSALTNKEKEQLLKSYVSEKTIVKDFSLTEADLMKIRKFDKRYLGYGYAVQLLFLRNKGVSLSNLQINIPFNILEYIGNQVKCPSDSFEKYWNIKNTKFRHFQEITMNLGFKKFTESSEISNYVLNLCLSNRNNIEIAQFLIEYLRVKRIIVPVLSKLEELITKGLNEANNIIFEKIVNQITDSSKLYNLFEIEASGNSVYSRIKNFTVNNSSNGVREVLKQIKEINEYNCSIDLSFLNESKTLYFSNEVLRSDKHKIERLRDESKRISYLAMFLYFRKKEFIDMVIEVTSKYAHTVMKRSKEKTKRHRISYLESYKANSEKLRDIIDKLLNIKEFEEFLNYKDSLVPLKKELELQDDDLDDIDFLLKSHQSFNYTNELLECIEFDSNTKPRFIELLKIFPTFAYKKKLDMDISFFSMQWQKNIKKFDYSKKVIEIAVLYSIRDYIRSGDIFVRESKKYKSFENYLIEPLEKVFEGEELEFLEKLKETLVIPKEINFETEIETDEKSTFSDKIYGYFPKITIPEVLYEVNTWTRILEDFRDLGSDLKHQQKVLIATMLANGHNIGFSKMAISSNISESTLSRANELYFTNDSLSKAQQNLVNYHHSLDIVRNWGQGTKASSDGMRVQITLKTIYADYNTHYGNKGGAMYRHVSDQYTPFYVRMLEARDSNHVLDGLLHHGTDLEILDHSTDTAGYTEQMFALTYFLGFNFKPRIKNLSQQQLYAFENIEIGETKFKKINEKIILENYTEVKRLVESIRCGKVKASLILQKIDSYARDNGVAKGLKEIGRILKTKYILDYYSDGTLRKEVQKMLNKGESINSLGRLMFFGKNGRLNESSIESQLEKASCLNILLSSLIIWNSRYLEKVYNIVKDEEWFDENEFKRVSPLGTQHVNFYGKYIFEEEIFATEDGLRPIKTKSQKL